MAGLDRSETLAASAAAIAQNGAPALARIAAEKAVLPFAADFRWLILSLHKVSLTQVALFRERQKIPSRQKVSRKVRVPNNPEVPPRTERGIHAASASICL